MGGYFTGCRCNQPSWTVGRWNGCNFSRSTQPRVRKLILSILTTGFTMSFAKESPVSTTCVSRWITGVTPVSCEVQRQTPPKRESCLPLREAGCFFGSSGGNVHWPGHFDRQLTHPVPDGRRVAARLSANLVRRHSQADTLNQFLNFFLCPYTRDGTNRFHAHWLNGFLGAVTRFGRPCPSLGRGGRTS